MLLEAEAAAAAHSWLSLVLVSGLCPRDDWGIGELLSQLPWPFSMLMTPLLRMLQWLHVHVLIDVVLKDRKY